MTCAFPISLVLSLSLFHHFPKKHFLSREERKAAEEVKGKRHGNRPKGIPLVMFLETEVHRASLGHPDSLNGVVVGPRPTASPQAGFLSKQQAGDTYPGPQGSGSQRPACTCWRPGAGLRSEGWLQSGRQGRKVLRRERKGIKRVRLSPASADPCPPPARCFPPQPQIPTVSKTLSEQMPKRGLSPSLASRQTAAQAPRLTSATLSRRGSSQCSLHSQWLSRNVSTLAWAASAPRTRERIRPVEGISKERQGI